MTRGREATSAVGTDVKPPLEIAWVNGSVGRGCLAYSILRRRRECGFGRRLAVGIEDCASWVSRRGVAPRRGGGGWLTPTKSWSHGWCWASQRGAGPISAWFGRERLPVAV